MARSTARMRFAAALIAAACVLPFASTAAAAGGEAAIRRARADSNAGIAAHDADRATASASEDTLFIVSGGGLLKGAGAMRAAFAANFVKPDFITYVRSPVTVRLSGDVASEEGRWVGRWRDRTFSGVYMARWNRTPAGWSVGSELYIPLGCRGPGCPP